MANAFLEIKNLSVRYSLGKTDVHAVRKVSLTVRKGECLGIIGESGSGKSSLASALMRSAIDNRAVDGSVFYEGTDLLALSEKKFAEYRWKKIALVFQNSLDVLNPVMTVGDAIRECIRKHLKPNRLEIEEKTRKAIRQVQLDESVLDSFPHELSGGMRQRVLIAMAVSCDPCLLIADEPTSAVDAATKREIIDLLNRLRKELNLTMIVISHEIDTVSALAEHMAVLYGGRVMEYGLTGEMISMPRHPYTRGLLNCCAQLHPYRDLWGINEAARSVRDHECPFAARCPQACELCSRALPEMTPLADDPDRFVACALGGIRPIMELKDICKEFAVKGKTVVACDHCSAVVYHGEIVSVLGQSGAGKSTLGMIAAGIETADSGEILFDGKPMERYEYTSKPGGMQIIFQDPFSSINGGLSVYKVISEPLRILKMKKDEILSKVIQALRDVGLSSEEDFMNRPCSTLSGGQRQRIAIARALVMEPTLLIADEICSMLDPSTQANVMRLLKSIQQSRGLSVLFITHDEFLSRKIADRTLRISEGVLQPMMENGGRRCGETDC